MNIREGFSTPIELPNIPEAPGVCLIDDQDGQTLQVAYSENIRRRIGQLLDSSGNTCVHGPKVYAAQQKGQRIFVRWKVVKNYQEEKKKLMQELKLFWV